jgi:hypothetical protein
MIETTGTLNLKIAQLEQRLKVLKQQQILSGVYPAHQAKLIEEDARVQQQLQQLLQRRQTLLQTTTGFNLERPFNDETRERKRSFYQAA